MIQGPPQAPTLTPTPEPEPEILTLEEFVREKPSSGPTYNNFYFYFAPDSAFGYFKVLQEPFKRLSSEHPDMVASLSNKIQNLLNDQRNYWSYLKSYEAELYEAYKIMRSYGASDEELFA
jgi:hypothetical protein